MAVSIKLSSGWCNTSLWSEKNLLNSLHTYIRALSCLLERILTHRTLLERNPVLVSHTLVRLSAQWRYSLWSRATSMWSGLDGRNTMLFMGDAIPETQELRHDPVYACACLFSNFLTWKKEIQKKTDPARIRTWNPLIRSQMPYPLGHRASCSFNH